MKPNIGIATFLDIQIARNYIPRNLDVKSNVDSPVPNATLSNFKSQPSIPIASNTTRSQSVVPFIIISMVCLQLLCLDNIVSDKNNDVNGNMWRRNQNTHTYMVISAHMGRRWSNKKQEHKTIHPFFFFGLASYTYTPKEFWIHASSSPFNLKWEDVPVELELICNLSILSYESNFLERGNYQRNFMKNKIIISLIFESSFKDNKSYRSHTVQM